MYLDLKSGYMGSSDMNNAIVVTIPVNGWRASHFSEHDIDMCDFSLASAFKNTVGYAAPCIVDCEFDFDTKLPQNNVGKHIRVRAKVNGLPISID